ncbi:hypothetical protein K503DRAFT_769022 [Rhizopogon vinicolor AM-OR11-026]|uniref:C2H2-type domain-containing protein n=1 Tax=Rhizopogon vinicolor AM-OR11-026 TaxID=1314800 RepID=A0A1B7N508_9AGAM|nr:hypothetical protein K503DRAFT_769022 [Rhizopogon vinicolor AM-OR11-026]
MQSPNFAGTSVSQSNETTSLSTSWKSVPDIVGIDQLLSGDFTFSQEVAEVMHHTTDLTGYHNTPENFLSFHSETADNEQFYYPSEPQDYIPLTADDSLAQAYVWSQANSLSSWFDPGDLHHQSFQAMISQPSVEQLKPMMPSQVFSRSPGDHHVCDWIENDVRCGQPIMGDILGAHLRNAHNVQGNEKKMLVCRWRDCGQELQRGGIRRHVATRHLNIKSHCHNCFKSFSRPDAMKKHARECQGA